MYYFEILALTIQIGYSLHSGSPFSVWGDSIFLLTQSIIILLMVWKMNNTIGVAIKLGFTSLMTGLTYYLFMMSPPENVWDLLVGNVVLINIAS